eukprot:259655_1
MILADGHRIMKEDMRKGAQVDVIRMSFEYSHKLWPWCGWLGIYIYAEEKAQKMSIATISGVIKVSIHVLNDDPNQQYNENDPKWIAHELSIPFSLNIIPTPPSNRRLLWDQYHNLQYPLGYLPRDDLEDSDMLDWFGDHLHTNYHTLFDLLKDKGYFIEILRTDYSCIDAQLYSTLIIVDNEDKFDANEVRKIHSDVLNHDLSIVIFADWYNEELMHDVRFFDDNTRSLWDALTGGANVVALNQLLHPFGIQFGDRVGIGDLRFGKDRTHSTYFQSGSLIMESPIHSLVMVSELQHLTRATKGAKPDRRKYKAIPLALYDTKHIHKGLNPGRIAVFGDSTCLDANQHRSDCFLLMEMLLRYTSWKEMNPDLYSVLTEVTEDNVNEVFDADYLSKMNAPQVVESVESLFNEISRVHHLHHVECLSNMDSIVDIDTMSTHKQLKAEVGHDDYKFVIEPHVNKQSIHHYDIVLFYPFLIVMLFIVMMFMLCPPIRKLFLCHKMMMKPKILFKFMWRKGRAPNALSLRKINGVHTSDTMMKKGHYHI